MEGIAPYDGRGAAGSLRGRIFNGALVALVLTTISGLIGGAVRSGDSHNVVSRQPGTPFSVTPAQGPALSAVSTSGVGCTGTNPLVQVWLSRAPEEAGDDFHVFNTTNGEGGAIDASGSWSVPLTITPLLTQGSYVINAHCLPNVAAPGAFFYASQPFEVLPGPVATWAVDPLTVEAGAQASVTVTGTACFGPDASVFVGAGGASERDFEESYGSATATPDEEGRWTAELVLRPRPPNSFYAIEASCSGSAAPFFYRPFFRVQALPRLVAGKAQRFTG